MIQAGAPSAPPVKPPSPLLLEPRTQAELAATLAVKRDLSDPQTRRALVLAAQKVEAEDRKGLLAKASALGLEVQGIRPNGRPFRLVGFEGDRPLYEEPDNINAAISTNADRVRFQPPHLVDGSEMVFGLWESGGVPRLTHQEFQGRVIVRDGTTAFSDHATHVGGTLAAAGINPLALGMAPAASIDAYDSVNDVSEMLAVGAAAAGESGKILISNHSYGVRRGWWDDGISWLGTFSDDGNPDNDVDFGFGRYDTSAALLDGLAYNLPYYLAFFSNGNMRSRGPPAPGATWFQGIGGTARVYDPAQHPAGNGQYKAGYDTMDGRKTAKNIISVGAVNDAVLNGVRHLPSATLTSFSSSGPTDDGRIKPDLVGNGASLFSPYSSSDTAYGTSSGTSMSTPNVAGSALLLQEHYSRFFAGSFMRASLLKGLLIHTADDLGTPGPDYLFGWGLMNTEAAAAIITKQAAGGADSPLIEDTLSTTESSHTHTFQWNGSEPIRVTLCWNDPPGNSVTGHDDRSPRLVNDLNLTVTGPSSTVHLPFVMPYVGNWSVQALAAPATTGVNNVDNVEQVFLPDPPQTGLYTVTINHSGPLTNAEQPYSLIISGGGVADSLAVMPISGLNASGDAGGPFAPEQKVYTLTNNAPSNVDWTAAVNQSWVSLSTTGGSLLPGNSAPLTVSLTPQALTMPVGIHTATVTITNTASGAVFSRTVTLRVLGYPEIIVEQPERTPLVSGSAAVAFGSPLLATSSARQFIIRNQGNSALQLGAQTLSGEHAAMFALGAPSTSLIPPGGFASLNVTYTPTAAGEHEATLTLASNDADSLLFSVDLTGEGLALPAGIQLSGTPNGNAAGLSGSGMVAMDGYALFLGNDFAYGRELWRSNGTAAGTFMIKDMEPGRATSNPGSLTRVGNLAFFSATTAAHGTELWVTDGTSAGTQLVLDISPGTASASPVILRSLNGVLYFTATTTAFGRELWRSDGTAAGTQMVMDIAPGSTSSTPSNLNVLNQTLYFAASDGVNGSELWRSDGTGPGTTLLSDINPGTSSSSPANLTVVGSTLFFAANNGSSGIELWKTDGTEAGTVQVRDIVTGSSNSSPTALVESNGLLFFRATTSAEGSEIWRSDGSSAGTFLVKDILAGTGSGVTTTPFVYNNLLYFTANDGAVGSELWTSDGTFAGTQLLKDLYVGINSSTPTLFHASHDKFFFTAFNESGRELWVSDGTANGTVLVRDIFAGNSSSTPGLLTDPGGYLLFFADDGVTGRELWRSNGTATGTYPIGDLVSGRESTTFGAFAHVNGRLFFNASTTTAGAELWRSDGPNSSTQLVRDITTGTASSSPAGLTALGTRLVFTASTTATGSEPHVSDGTSGGTLLLQDLRTGTASSAASQLRRVGNQVFFRADNGTTGSELYKTDGTPGGTVLVRDINVGSNSSMPLELIQYRGLLFMNALTSTAGAELWRSDGSNAGTVMVSNIATGSTSSSPSNFQMMNGRLYFSAFTSSQGRELWTHDRSSGTTTLVADINPGTASSSPSNLVAMGNTLFFTTTDSAVGTELWKSDGTVGGTVMVANIAAGSLSSSPINLTVCNGLLYFSADDNTHGRELWRSDGTSAGTYRLKDIATGSASSSPAQLVNMAGTLYFTANDGAYGTEVWTSDGTAAGTLLFADIYPGPLGSDPANLTACGPQLFFHAAHPSTGTALYHFRHDVPSELRVAAPADTPLESGSSVLRFDAASTANTGIRVLHFENAGTRRLSLSSLILKGPDAAHFTLGPLSQDVLFGNDSATLDLQFTPLSAGIKTAQLEIRSDDPVQPVFRIFLTNAAAIDPALVVEHPPGVALPAVNASVNFGVTTLGSPPLERTFVLRNSVPGSLLQIHSATLTGSGASSYVLDTTNLSDSLFGSNTTSLRVSFWPLDGGMKTAVLQLATNHPTQPVYSITLQATGQSQPGPQQQIGFFRSPETAVAPGSPPFPLNAVASSGLPLHYEVVAGPVTVSSAGLVTPTGGTGAVTLRVRQDGGGGYDPTESLVTFQIASWPSFRKIRTASSTWATFALSAEGTLWTWGMANAVGQLGDSTSLGRATPLAIGTATDWTDIAVGGSFGLGLRADGTLWAWGSNSNGQLGDGTIASKTTPTAIVTSNTWKAISAGGSFSAAVATNGTLWSWGINSNGQLGHGGTTQVNTPTQVGSDSNWLSVSCGLSHTFALKSNGELWAWGANASGQLGLGNTTQQNTPTRVGSASDWLAVASGSNHTLALKTDGTLWACGTGFSGQLGTGANQSSNNFIQVGTDTDWVSISASFGGSAALKVDGSAWVWGSNSGGQLGDGTFVNQSTPQRFNQGENWIDLAMSSTHVVGLRADGTVWVSGSGRGFSGTSPRVLTRSTTPTAAWSSLHGTGSHFHALRSDNTLWAWGLNTSSQMGNGISGDLPNVTQIGSLNSWTSVAAGGHSVVSNATFAIQSDATLWATGSNSSSRLGDGTTNVRSTFIPIGAGINWRQASPGSSHTMAVATNGTLWGWGLNSSNQLGQGVTTNQTTPVQTGTDSDWLLVSCGGSFSLGIKNDGSLWAWGSNTSGQLGLGDTSSRNVPTRIGTTNDWSSIACGINHCLALKSDGSLWAWGLNSSGQLGRGNTSNASVPTRIANGVTFTRIAASRNSSAAIGADGSLWTCGENLSGQTGQGGTSNQHTLSRLGSATGWQHVAINCLGLAAIQSDGSLWTAGTAGPLALGACRDQSRPTLVMPGLQPQHIISPQATYSSMQSTLQLSSTSGLPVSLRVLSGPATVAGDRMQISGPGTVVVQAWQAGDERAWDAAPLSEFTLTITAPTPEELFDAAMTTAGLTGNSAQPNEDPFDDGIANLLKYAFNMDLTRADNHTMSEQGNSGLPRITTTGNGSNGVFRFEFVRRIGSGLIYTPRKNSSLASDSWEPLTAAPTIQPIDSHWERLVYEEPVDLTSQRRCFGQVLITLP